MTNSPYKFDGQLPIMNQSYHHDFIMASEIQLKIEFL